jgi:hypothetical protein
MKRSADAPGEEKKAILGLGVNVQAPQALTRASDRQRR